MTSAYAAVAVAIAVLLVESPGHTRTRRLAVGPPARPRRARSRVAEDGGDDLLAVGAGAAMLLLVGGTAGLFVGAVSAVVARWAVRRGRRLAGARVDAEVVRALPPACDLLAACVAAGAAPNEALAQVSRVVAGPLHTVLTAVVQAISLGVPAGEAWAAQTVGGPPALRAVAAALVRSSVSGASPGAAIEALAAEQRERQRLGGEAAARRAGVVMVAPLGLCFLPAFVLVGVVPLVAGLLGPGLAAVR